MEIIIYSEGPKSMIRDCADGYPMISESGVSTRFYAHSLSSVWIVQMKAQSLNIYIRGNI